MTTNLIEAAATALAGLAGAAGEAWWVCHSRRITRPKPPKEDR